MHDSRGRATMAADGGTLPDDRYRGYADWKGWAGAAAAGVTGAETFAAEFGAIALRDRDVLEIGFGDGAFLAWARAAGARVCGIERDPLLVERARAAGFEAHLVDLGATGPLAGRRFHAIVAFDVLEHVPMETLLDWFDRMPMLLHAGGHLLARFPNGQSPFGRVFQNGDLTHVTTLSPAIARQLGQRAGLEVVRVGNSHRPRGTGIRRLARAARDGVRGGIEIAVARLYGIERLPLDPNVTVVWRLADQARSK